LGFEFDVEFKPWIKTISGGFLPLMGCEATGFYGLNPYPYPIFVIILIFILIIIFICRQATQAPALVAAQAPALVGAWRM